MARTLIGRATPGRTKFTEREVRFMEQLFRNLNSGSSVSVLLRSAENGSVQGKFRRLAIEMQEAERCES